MSSPTEFRSRPPGHQVRRAARRAALSRYGIYGVAAFALALLGAFLYEAGLYAYLKPAITPPSPHIENPGEITSYGSSLTGKDSSGQPYEIAASRGWQDPDAANVFHLERVEATLHRAAGAPYRLTADTARFDSRTRIADVAGAVSIAQERRFTAHMEKARIDMGARSLVSDTPVKVDLAQGTITANGLKITDDGTHILFLNGVKAHFETAEPQGATP
jgi:LPS export ABC transporter protein LptC